MKNNDFALITTTSLSAIGGFQRFKVGILIQLAKDWIELSEQLKLPVDVNVDKAYLATFENQQKMWSAFIAITLLLSFYFAANSILGRAGFFTDRERQQPIRRPADEQQHGLRQ